MLPELVRFHNDYEGRMTIRSLNLSENPGAQGDLPVSVIPTQFFFNADGSPYVPTGFALGAFYELLTDEDGAHILTKHAGHLSYDDMVAVYEDLASP